MTARIIIRTKRIATISGRINTPISPETRSRMVEVASGRGVRLAELGR